MKFSGEVKIYHLIEGAKQAVGTVVIIDVFRAFSLEPYLYAMGAAEIRPVGTIEEAFAWREKDPDCVLIGERKGIMCEGFDFGNSPSTVDPERIRGRRIIHTTSAGTQGIVNAVHADQILTGSLVNARAIAAYIKEKNPAKVSIVCMGNRGIAPAAEDELCARYLKALLLEEDFPDFDACVKHLQFEGGTQFFDPAQSAVFPEQDFWMSIDYDRFDFVLRVEKDPDGYRSVVDSFRLK